MNINYNIYENQVDKIPVTETAIVAFIDILGFKELIKEYDNGINQNLLKDIISSMNTAVDFLKMNINNEPDFLNWKKKLKLKLFSDCLCASIPAKFDFYNFEENLFYFMLYLSTYQNLLIEKGIFVRGGISIGSFYSDDNIIFSGALVKAVELEKRAKFPRIVIDKDLIVKLRNNQHFFNYFICEDNTNEYFINNFNHYDIESNIINNNLDLISKTNLNFIKRNEEIIEKIKEFEKNQYNQDIEKYSEIIKYQIDKCQFCQQYLEKYKWQLDFLNWNIDKNNNNYSFKFNSI